MPSATMPYPKKRVTAFSHNMAYVEAGQGDPIVFLQGIARPRISGAT
jgi:haloalkane dehalogenase